MDLAALAIWSASVHGRDLENTLALAFAVCA